MIYFDTNVLVYAISKNVDDENQQKLSIKLLEEAIKDDTILLSQISLYELAFILKKLNNSNQFIDEVLEFLSQYILSENINVYQKVLEIMKNTNSYKSSFDVYHLAFSEFYNAKLITFDKGFSKFKDFNIEILQKDTQ